MGKRGGTERARKEGEVGIHDRKTEREKEGERELQWQAGPFYPAHTWQWQQEITSEVAKIKVCATTPNSALDS